METFENFVFSTSFFLGGGGVKLFGANYFNCLYCSIRPVVPISTGLRLSFHLENVVIFYCKSFLTNSIELWFPANFNYDLAAFNLLNTPLINLLPIRQFDLLLR